MNSAEPSRSDLDTVSLQLGRPVRDVVEISARCRCGSPLVVATAPRLSNGIPFPTIFYLTHPTVVQEVSRLEASGVMEQMNRRLSTDSELAEAYRGAHQSYLQAREEIARQAVTDPVPEIAGVSAGGMPERVKCLHALVAHSLAAGPGVNPLGDEALQLLGWEPRVAEESWIEWEPPECLCEGAWDPYAEVPRQELSRHVRKANQGYAAGAANPGSSRVAAIDCGTNSVRLLIADRAGQGIHAQLQDLERQMRVVRLGEGVDATGEFSEAALERTFTALDDYAQLLAEHRVTQVRAVATSASRDVTNRAEFIAGFQQHSGVAPEVISGQQEAELSFIGALNALSSERREEIVAQGGKVLVIDLGGGSTELVLGTVTGEVQAAISVNMGCVRFTERFLRSDPPSDEEKNQAVQEVRRLMKQAALTVPWQEAAAVIGVAGTVTTVTARALDLPEYQPEVIHGAELPIVHVRAAASELTAMSRSQRAELPYMHPGRVDVIGAGALIWSTVLSELASSRVNTVITSEHDILDGIALTLG